MRGPPTSCSSGSGGRATRGDRGVDADPVCGGTSGKLQWERSASRVGAVPDWLRSRLSRLKQRHREATVRAVAQCSRLHSCESMLEQARTSALQGGPGLGPWRTVSGSSGSTDRLDASNLGVSTACPKPEPRTPPRSRSSKDHRCRTSRRMPRRPCRPSNRTRSSAFRTRDR